MLKFLRHGSAALLLLLPCLGATAGAETGADDGVAKARALAQRSLDALGGQAAWDAVRYLRFNFAGFRLHHWDKYEGRHRFEGKTQEGQAYVVLLNLNSREGDAWLNGEHLSGEAKTEWLERAYGAWVNDTYWLLMPYKLFDPGVQLHYEGEEALDGKPHDKVRLTFEQVGLTPGDTYWVYFNRDTGLVDRWSYVLEGWEKGREATAWTWGGWQKHGAVLLPTEHQQVGGDRQLPLQELAVFDTLPDAVFDSPAPVAGTADQP
jgi:hypothetical protein